MKILDRSFAILMLPAAVLWAHIAVADQIILDDLIVSGSLCTGFDCVNGESFGFDTIRLKENNLRIRFQDTSNTSSFPSNDWQLTANDSTNGGANKFSIDDVDAGRTPFTIEAGARTNALYLDDRGHLGLGTNSPAVDIHVKTGNTPSMRLEQDGSSGFTPQTWDVASNEANFFIRDTTGGSSLPFRIFPGAPTNALAIDKDGQVGVGVQDPDAALHVKSDDEFLIVVSDLPGEDKFVLDSNGNINITGRLRERSDRNAKADFVLANGEEVLQRVADLPISTWRYKTDEPGMLRLGPTAQDFYSTFGLGNDDGRIAPMDATSVALAAVQELHKRVESRDAAIAQLKERVAALEVVIARLERNGSALVLLSASE